MRVLAFDIGGTSVRAGLFDGKGNLLFSAAGPSPEIVTEDNRSEIDPDLWWNKVLDLTEEIFDRSQSECSKIRGVVATSVTRTQIFLDADGRVLRPAVCWSDSRAESQALKLKEIAAPKGKKDRGEGTAINAYHPLARILWVGEHEPHVLAKTRWVLQPKDYIHFKLTGNASGDRISSHHFFDPSTGRFETSRFHGLGVDPKIVPPLGAPHDRVGDVRPGLPHPFDKLSGVPVFAGSMDTWCCTLGIGANRPGFAYNITGTTEAVGVVGRRWGSAPGVLTVPWGDGLVQIGGPSQSGGDCIRWFVDAFSTSFDSNGASGDKGIDRILGEQSSESAGRVPLLFLPYLTGERAPIWDPDARGVFFGVDRSHTAHDFLDAVLEGIAFSNRHMLELAENAAGLTTEEIRIAGGAARFDRLCRIKADVLGRTIVKTSEAEAGLFGAALLALKGLGIVEDLSEAQQTLVKEQRRFNPRPDRHAYYSGLYGIYRKLYSDVRLRFKELSAFRSNVEP